MDTGILALVLAFGGGVGAVFRYIAGLVIMKKYPHPPFPVAMLTVNLIGSLGLGLLFGKMYDDPEILYNNTYFVGIGIGFFGAFTTFSTFSVEAIQLIKEKLYRKTCIYVGLSIIGSILGFMIGFYVMRSV